ncbi:MAG: S46 family peptidase, partial [Myxococcota bacterium]
MLKGFSFIAFFLLSASIYADEGMFTFDNPPIEQIEKKYNIRLDKNWFEHSMKASLRFNNGGSGSFVSKNGLVMTNHHIGFDCIQKISSREKDYVRDGFMAKSREEEARCPDLEVNMLYSLEDVTERVLAQEQGAKDDKERGKRRKMEMAKIEKECNEKTGLRCNVVTLYGGGQYVLYRYKKFTDVRLVFAPEQQIAFFGGDPDNFTYPRYDLDITFFRIYENGKPYQPEYYFKFSESGAKENELVFVVGNPGTTRRLNTVSQLIFQRDIFYPARVKKASRFIESLKKYASGSDENARETKELIFMFENSYKANKGMLDALLSKEVFDKKVSEEKSLLSSVANNPQDSKDLREALKKIESAQNEYKKLFPLAMAIRTIVNYSELFSRAFTIVQMVLEKKKPNEERFEEYRDTGLPSLEHQLYSTAPIYKGVEKVLLKTAINEAINDLSDKNEFIRVLLSGKKVDEFVDEVVEKSRIYDVEYRKELVKKGDSMKESEWREFLSKVDDPLLRVAYLIEPIVRKNRKMYEDKVESVERGSARVIQNIRFKVYGKSLPPDATFTPRIAYGVVKGYEMGGTIAPYKTSFYGLYERAADFDNKPPFNLPPRYIEREKFLNMKAPLNFVSTADIVGGNSGSPVINVKHQIVGLIFDSNIYGLAGTFVYSEEKARAVSVHSSGIIEALRSIYEMNGLIDE